MFTCQGRGADNASPTNLLWKALLGCVTYQGDGVEGVMHGRGEQERIEHVLHKVLGHARKLNGARRRQRQAEASQERHEPAHHERIETHRLLHQLRILHSVSGKKTIGSKERLYEKWPARQSQ